MWEKLPANEMVLLHSSIRRTCRENGMKPAEVLVSFLDAIGPRGTLLLPTFTYDRWCHGEPFDVLQTPSDMGALTEAGRKSGYAVRTGNPMYSFAVIGHEAKTFERLDNHSGYGGDSPFAMLIEADGWIASLDLPPGHTNTIYHHVEQMHSAPYRYPKLFKGKWTGWNGETVEDKGYELWVRDLQQGWHTRVDLMDAFMWEMGLYRGNKEYTHDGLRIVRARALYRAVAAVIRLNLHETFLGYYA
jgi:aminoglycoside 3-N-acetyltransferase